MKFRYCDEVLVNDDGHPFYRMTKGTIVSWEADDDCADHIYYMVMLSHNHQVRFSEEELDLINSPSRNKNEMNAMLQSIAPSLP